ncbi:undecaprenyl-phosphate glucose phosphotransferase [Flavobacterium sp.]|uniref:undecaprenyl-phosphate glucose phosphotransferase n=1 Tax=Flavobacterium sp. TaxID=239 RepID=UPI003753094F
MSFLKTIASYRFSRYYKLGFLVSDIVLLNVAIVLSFLFRYGNLHMIHLKGVRTVCVLSNILWIFLLLYKDSFRIIRIERIETILIRTIQLILVHIGIISVFILVLDYDEISRLRLIYFYGTFFVFLVFFRIMFMKVLKYIRTQGYNYRKVVIVGANETGERMNKILSKDLTYGYRVMGFFDDNADKKTILSAPFLGRFSEIENYLIAEKVDEIYIALHISKIGIINALTTICERYMVRIKFLPDFEQYTHSHKVEISFYGNVPVLMLRKEPLEITINRVIKKLFDFCFSLFIIVFIFPWLFPILILLIKGASPGPVFFVQERSGRDNLPFRCYKFRTMRVESGAEKDQVTQNDTRVTRVGSFLRRTSMDELPQFFNVLLGNMSVVGPRPHMLLHTNQYSELINNYMVRHYAKPGITGWAQVNGLRGEIKKYVDVKDRVDHDIWYIENWSLMLDIKIIWKTIFDVLKKDENVY